FLVGVAEHEHVGRDGVAHQGGGELRRADEIAGLRRFTDVALEIRAGELPVRIPDELGRGRYARVHHGAGTRRRHLRDGFGARRHHETAAEHEVGAAGVEARGVDVLGRRADLHVRRHGAVFLRETRHVEDAHTLAFEVRRHADDLADGDHPRAADAGDEDSIGIVQRWSRRLPDGREFLAALRGRLALLQPSALDRDEARAEALEARVVLVARGLVDRPLAPIFGLERLDGKTVRLHAAVAAALAHHLVDHDALGRIRVLVALAPPALLRSAGLVVDQCRYALDLT